MDGHVPTPITREDRAYQNRAVAEIIDRVTRAIRRVLIVAPTGSGKTVIFARITCGAVAKGSPVLILAHRRELIDQTVDKVLAAGVPRSEIGVVMAGDRRFNARALVQVASVDTLRNRIHKPPARIVIIDEAHRALAASYAKISEAYPDAIHLGFTATPWRLDGKGLGDHYNDLVVVSTVPELIDEGYLVQPRVFSHPKRPDASGIATSRGDYNETQLAELCDRRELIGNIVEHWQRHSSGQRTLAFGVNVAHSKHIAEMFCAAGVAAEHLDGTTALDERAAILRRFKTGATLVVANCAVLTEGFDEPAAKCAILARPTKSRTLYFQCVGRVLRPVPGHPEINHATILDHAGCAHEHGLPDDPQEYSLEGRKKHRGAAVAVRTCDRCFAVLPASTRTCPMCGHEFAVVADPEPIAERDGDLVETQQHADSRERQALRKKINSLSLHEDRRRNWAPGTTNSRLRHKFGKARSDMTLLELYAVYQYLDGGAFAHDAQPATHDAPPPPWLAKQTEVVTWPL